MHGKLEALRGDPVRPADLVELHIVSPREKRRELGLRAGEANRVGGSRPAAAFRDEPTVVGRRLLHGGHLESELLRGAAAEGRHFDAVTVGSLGGASPSGMKWREIASGFREGANSSQARFAADPRLRIFERAYIIRFPSVEEIGDYVPSLENARIARRRQTTKNDRLSHGANEFSSHWVRHRLMSRLSPHLTPAIPAQFPMGSFSPRSTIRVSTGAFRISSFSPSCCWMAE